jgi:hypothetical protein
MHLAISQKKKTYWRTGVLLAIDGNEAVVKADLEAGRVFVTVRGPEASRRRALSAIRLQFDHIHDTIPGLKPEEKVPVPGQTCKPVDYRHLLKLEERGIETFLPEGAEEAVSVRRLRDGIEGRDERAKRKDELLEDKSFVELMTIAVKSLVFLRSDTKPGATPELPEAPEKKEPMLPEPSGARRIPSPTRPAPQLPAPESEAEPKKSGTEKN